MNQLLQAPPKCEKCGAEKSWAKDRQKKLGGYFRCNPCASARQLARYHASGGEINKAELARRKSKRAANRAENAPTKCDECGAPIEQRGVGTWKTKCDKCVKRNRRSATKTCRANNIVEYNAVANNYNRTHRAEKAAWRTQNRERMAEGEEVYRSKCRDSFRALDEIDKDICRWFYRHGAPKGLTVDHIQPVALGGLHQPWNFQLLTRSENCSKRAKRPTLGEVMRGERRYRLLRRMFENAESLGANARGAA